MSSHLAFLLPRASSNAPADRIGIGPLALIVASVIRNRSEQVGSVSALTIGLLFIAAGPVLYFHARAFRPQRINP